MQKYLGAQNGHATALLLAKLGLDEQYQGCGFGKELFNEACKIACKANDLIGVRLLKVDALDESLIAFYQKVGMTNKPGTRKCSMKIDEIKQRLKNTRNT